MKTLLIALLGLCFPLTIHADDFRREGTKEERKLKDALEGKAPPQFHVKEWFRTKQKKISLEDFKGKVVLIDFWSMTCIDCLEHLPHLKKLHKKHHKNGLVILGIHPADLGDKIDVSSKVELFAEMHDVPWPVGVDTDEKTRTAFNADAFPDYFLIDRSGKLRIADLETEDLIRATESLLKEKAPNKK